MANVVALDIGGTSTKIGIVMADGEIEAFRRIPTEATGRDPEPFLARLYGELDALLATPVGQKTVGIGVSMHGEVDPDRRGPIIAGNTPALRNFDMRGALEQRYHMTVALNNDLVAHALGEYYFGCCRNVRRFMCMAMGTGLGAGMIVDGKPLIIDGGNSGNTGLIIVDPNGPRDSNGIRGSAEGFCGVPGIERMAREIYGRPVPAHEVIAAAREGTDPMATDIIRTVGTYVGQALASLSVIYYPHVIALTGGTTTAGNVLLEACRHQFDHLVGDFFRDLAANTSGHFRDVEIILGEGGGETGLKGAAVELLQAHELL